MEYFKIYDNLLKKIIDQIPCMAIYFLSRQSFPYYIYAISANTIPTGSSIFQFNIADKSSAITIIYANTTDLIETIPQHNLSVHFNISAYY